MLNKPGAETGKKAQQDTRLNVPNPVEVLEKDWATQEPIFDKYTAMRIKRPPGADETSSVFDYFINMNNVFIDQAIKERPKKVHEIRNRYKFGMTFIALALIRQDLEARKHVKSVDDDEEVTPPQDLRDRVSEVTSAISPFLLPLIDSLSRITSDFEAMSATAGETV